MPFDELNPAADTNALCAHYRRMVERMAYRLETPLSPREDLEQAAYISLIGVAQRFDAKLGIRFSTFAKHRVLGAMLDARRLDRQRGTGREPRARYKVVQNTDGSELLHCDCGAQTQHDGGLRCSACGFTHRAVARTTVIGLCDVTIRGADDADPMQPEDIFASPADQEQKLISREVWDTILASKILTPRLLRVLTMRYIGELTMQEIGTVLNVNESRASQLHKLALANLRNYFVARGISRASDLT